MLTSYNGKTIAYDTIGNPLSDGTWTYTWQAGRQLKKMTKSGMTVEFQYDHNGLRTQKKVTEGNVTTTTRYYLHGKLLTHITIGSDNLHFFYDNQQRPTKVNFNGTIYTYLQNQQGDIVGIVDGNGNLVVEYKYDAWGKPLSTTNVGATTLSKANPFRYRGYIYDEETNLYYLRKRYYSSNMCRFLTSDLQTEARSLYTYCANSPVIWSDWNGTKESQSESNGDITDFMREGFFCTFITGPIGYNPMTGGYEKNDMAVMYIPYQNIQYYNNAILFESENPLDVVQNEAMDEVVSAGSSALTDFIDNAVGYGRQFSLVLSILGIASKYREAVTKKAQKENHHEAAQSATNKKTGMVVVIKQSSRWRWVKDVANVRGGYYSRPTISHEIKYYELTEYLAKR